MSEKKYYGHFDESPIWRPVGSSPPAGSGLSPCSFVARYIPEKAEPYGVIFDLFSQEVHCFGSLTKETVRLKAVLAALEPHFRELVASWLTLSEMKKGLTPDSDSEAKDLAQTQKFLASWLYWRCKDAFDVICDLPLEQMPAAALAFKPTGTESFASDLARNGYCIRLIEAEFLTDEHCLIALSDSPGALKFIPEHRRTEHICRHAMGVQKSSLGALQYVPGQLRDQQMCEMAVLSDYTNLRHVPALTTDICALACLKSGLAWDLVPHDFRALEVEFCASLHHFGPRPTVQVYADMLKARPELAAVTADKYSDMYIRMHYQDISGDELSDLGLAYSDTARHEQVPSRGC